jgi:Na+/H+ antiporter NhaD/arsenite permease-like protein
LDLTPAVFFQYLATSLFALAVLHTFVTGKLNQWAKNFPEGSVTENFLHLFGEIEVVFGFWSAILFILAMIFINFDFAIHYLEGRNFTEALFVFVIMAVCSTRPILKLAEQILIRLSLTLPANKNLASYFTILFLGPLLGSLITEPAAMTICAYLLLPRFFTRHHPLKMKYATIALLFVNISLGGTLTPYAAPPILMVASKWGWDLNFMVINFAPKTLVVLFFNTLAISMLFRKEISKTMEVSTDRTRASAPILITLIHLAFLTAIVMSAHHSVLFTGIFLFFMGFMKATKEYQTPLQLREPLLVGFFLAGLIVLGGPQNWWLEPLLGSMSRLQLYLGAIGLTGITDNAALTYLGSLVPNLDDATKLALVSGSVIGGGLTVIANAPNPAGFGILRDSFSDDGFSHLRLFLWALPLTVVAAVIFALFSNI